MCSEALMCRLLLFEWTPPKTELSSSVHVRSITTLILASWYGSFHMNTPPNIMILTTSFAMCLHSLARKIWSKLTEFWPLDAPTIWILNCHTRRSWKLLSEGTHLQSQTTLMLWMPLWIKKTENHMLFLSFLGCALSHHLQTPYCKLWLWRRIHHLKAVV